jgi:tetratricopeptide (TPR) repeat protein
VLRYNLSELMPTYTWTAKDSSGKTVVREITANTADDAKANLLAQGLSDPILEEDDVMNAVRAGFETPRKFLGDEVKVTAKDRLKALNNPTVTFWDAIKQSIAKSFFLIAIISVLIARDFYLGRFYTALILIVALLFWLIVVAGIFLPSIYYKKMILAADWDRWDEVLSLVNTLKTIGKFSIVKIPDTELTRYRAKAFAGTGRLSEALAEFEKCKGRPDCPSWMYKLFVAGLYTKAKHYDMAIKFNLMSIEEKPTSTAWADLSYRYARYLRNPKKAREAMAEADRSPMVELAKPFRARCLGVIAYLEGDCMAAKRELETAINSVQNVKWRPFKDGHLSVARAYLCCVSAKLGDLTSAKKNFALAKDYLVATKEDELLAECRQATGEYN